MKFRLCHVCISFYREHIESFELRHHGRCSWCGRYPADAVVRLKEESAKQVIPSLIEKQIA